MIDLHVVGEPVRAVVHQRDVERALELPCAGPVLGVSVDDVRRLHAAPVVSPARIQGDVPGSSRPYPRDPVTEVAVDVPSVECHALLPCGQELRSVVAQVGRGVAVVVYPAVELVGYAERPSVVRALLDEGDGEQSGHNDDQNNRQRRILPSHGAAFPNPTGAAGPSPSVE